MGSLDRTIDELPDTEWERARREPSLQLAGTGLRMDLTALQERGVRLAGRLAAVEADGVLRFADDLALSRHACRHRRAAVRGPGGGGADEATRYIAEAEKSASRWDYTAWQAALVEARAHLADAQGDPIGGARLMAEAATMFQEAGQPLDAARCRETAVAHHR